MMTVVQKRATLDLKLENIVVEEFPKTENAPTF